MIKPGDSRLALQAVGASGRVAGEEEAPWARGATRVLQPGAALVDDLLHRREQAGVRRLADREENVHARRRWAAMLLLWEQAGEPEHDKVAHGARCGAHPAKVPRLIEGIAHEAKAYAQDLAASASRLSSAGEGERRGDASGRGRED